jgi:methylated-DNA-[protein]-cysteine S-methyltransferase
MTTVTTSLATPVGPFTLVANDAGVVRAAGFTTSVADLIVLLPPAWREEPRPRGDLGDVSKAVHAYLAGDLAALDAVPVEQRPVSPGGSFLDRAWRELRRIPAGQVVTYTELAASSGRPAAFRAAASACARNAAALFVPCHRVRRADDSLGGYRWGLPVKRWLLAHEAGVPVR